MFIYSDYLKVPSKDLKTKPSLDDEILSRPTNMDDEMLPSPRETLRRRQRALLYETAKDIQKISWERFPLSVDTFDKNHAGSLLEGFPQIQINTLAVNDDFWSEEDFKESLLSRGMWDHRVSIGQTSNANSDSLTLEQHLALTRGNQAPGVVKLEIGGNVNFEIKSRFMQELREDTFSINKNDDAHEHVEQVLDIVSLFNILGVSHDAWNCPPLKIAKQLEETATSSTKVMRIYTKPGTYYNDLLLYPLMTSIAIRRNIEGSSNSEGITAIVRKLDNLGRDLTKLKENVHAIQVGCQNCEGAQLNKDCPLNKEVKSVEEAKYGEFGRPSPFSNRAKYRVGPPGYYTRNDNRLSFGEKRPSLEELMNKHLEE
ncbi:hypothetical protein Tco_1107163 [Tanacetum coccineum]